MFVFAGEGVGSGSGVATQAANRKAARINDERNDRMEKRISYGEQVGP
jgi:hypothetical protein